MTFPTLPSGYNADDAIGAYTDLRAYLNAVATATDLSTSELGSNPSGAYSTVVDRLAAADTTDSNHTTAIDGLAAIISHQVSDTLIDAKGDLIVGSTSDTVVRLAVGSNTQVLTADSTASAGVKWATPSSGGGGGAAGDDAQTVIPVSIFS